ncbi:hypothetical protein PG995_005106 [Apiospora arundinis]
MLNQHRGFSAYVVGISAVNKRGYTAAAGASLGRLLGGRLYKGQHQEGLTAFFQNQVRQNLRLPEQPFSERSARC